MGVLYRIRLHKSAVVLHDDHFTIDKRRMRYAAESLIPVVRALPPGKAKVFEHDLAVLTTLCLRPTAANRAAVARLRNQERWITVAAISLAMSPVLGISFEPRAAGGVAAGLAVLIPFLINMLPMLLQAWSKRTKARLFAGRDALPAGDHVARAEDK